MPLSSASGQALSARLDKAIVEQAAEWAARLQSGDATEAEHAACEAWRGADPAHELAWQRMSLLGNQMRDRLAPVPPAVARQVLGSRHSETRRTVLKSVAAIGVVSGAAWLTARHAPWAIVMADYRTRAGERRTVTLSDGTQVILNTGSAIDVRFDRNQRRLVLHGGEIQVTTARDAAARPLHVQTRLGQIVPLGTRFIVRDVPDGEPDHHSAPARLHDAARPIAVAVQEGAVRIVADNGATLGILEAGQRTTFTPEAQSQPEPLSDTSSAWLDGMLVADHMPMTTFIAELARYRRGVVHCDPALAALQVSGAFAIDDTDATLALLEATFPLRVQYLTRYWVRVMGG